MSRIVNKENQHLKPILINYTYRIWLSMLTTQLQLFYVMAWAGKVVMGV